MNIPRWSQYWNPGILSGQHCYHYFTVKGSVCADFSRGPWKNDAYEMYLNDNEKNYNCECEWVETASEANQIPSQFKLD